MTPGRRSRLRDRVLNEKGLAAPGYGVVIPIDEVPTPFAKTSLMKLLEIKHNKSIITLLYADSNVYTTAKLLSISPSIVSKWRKRIRASNVL